MYYFFYFQGQTLDYHITPKSFYFIFNFGKHTSWSHSLDS